MFQSSKTDIQMKTIFFKPTQKREDIQDFVWARRVESIGGVGGGGRDVDHQQDGEQGTAREDSDK